jgi:uncharacterized protein (DUF1800 family)
LFLLGEGHYTEADIKEAARAFTGYRAPLGEFRFNKKQHDDTPKTLFGQTDSFDGDDVVDLAYRQPAAATFLPQELAKFYLSDEPLPPAHLAALGALWAAAKFDLRTLALTFFGSRLFFDPAARGNYIKSPVHFYLGLIQDLNLDVAPYARHALTTLRLMGQTPYRPPNVRGWVGGRQWINSATLAARRQLVQALFTPIDEARLNADEQVDLVAARADGMGNITVTDERLAAMLNDMNAAEITARFVDYFLSSKVSSEYRATILDFLSTEKVESRRIERLRNTVVTLLQSPEYQLA